MILVTHLVRGEHKENWNRVSEFNDLNIKSEPENQVLYEISYKIRLYEIVSAIGQEMREKGGPGLDFQVCNWS